MLFFAYLGFDALSTAAEETKNPERNMPIGIISALAICTVLYIAVCAAMTGVVPYPELDTAAPASYPFISWRKLAVPEQFLPSFVLVSALWFCVVYIPIFPEALSARQSILSLL